MNMTGDGIMEKFLVNTNEYNGRYVALKSFEDNSIVGVGDDPESALKDALAKGVDDPVLVYVTEADTVYIY
jgi:microcystin degradation protein MlrC